MLFEISIFFATIFNAFSRPRAENIPLASILHRDGALFFFVSISSVLINQYLYGAQGVTCLRVVNLAFAATTLSRRIGQVEVLYDAEGFEMRLIWYTEVELVTYLARSGGPLMLWRSR